MLKREKMIAIIITTIITIIITIIIIIIIISVQYTKGIDAMRFNSKRTSLKMLVREGSRVFDMTNVKRRLQYGRKETRFKWTLARQCRVIAVLWRMAIEREVGSS